MSLGQFLWASQTRKLSIFVLSGHGLLTYTSILPKYYLTLNDNVFKGSNIVNLPSSYWCIPFEEILVCCHNAHLFIMEILILTHSRLIFNICHSLQCYKKTLSNKYEF